MTKRPTPTDRERYTILANHVPFLAAGHNQHERDALDALQWALGIVREHTGIEPTEAEVAQANREAANA